MGYELINEIWATARRNKLRTALTGFSVAWGIFMIIFLLGAGNGLINAQLQSSDRYLVNSMKVIGGRTSVAYDGLDKWRRIWLNDLDMETTRTAFGQVVDKLTAVSQQSGKTLTIGSEYMTGQSVTGVYPEDALINKRELLAGRYVNDADMREKRKVMVLSEDQVHELVKTASRAVGRYVLCDGLPWLVVGVYKSDGMRQSNEAFAPYTTVRSIYGRGDQVGDIEFTFHGLVTEDQNNAFERDYTAKINLNHRAAPSDESAVWLRNRYMDNIQMAKGISILRTALWVVGLLTLLSGVVGVSNIMLITVRERTREFGIRKAIGASPWSILRLIIVESVVMTTIFGFVGMLCGIAANEYMNATIGHMEVDAGLFKAAMFVNPTVGLDVCLEAMVVMVVAGTIAGLMPARRAARVRPIEALKVS